MAIMGHSPSRGALRAASALQPPAGLLSGLALHPQGHRVVTFSGDVASGLTLWSIDPPRRLSHQAFPAGLADVGAELSESWWPFAWRFHTEPVPPHALPVVDLAASRRGDDFAVATGRSVRLVRISEDDSDLMDRGVRIPVQEGAAARVALSAKAQRLLVADTARHVSVWTIGEDPSAFSCDFRFRISQRPHVLQFLWADRLALCGDDVGRITCWELQGGERHLQFQAHRGVVRAADFCVQDRLLVTAGDDGAARLWDLEQGAQRGPDMQHEAPVLSAVFAGGGKFLLTSSTDGRITAWDTRSGEPLDHLLLGPEPISLATTDVRGVTVASRLRAIHLIHVDFQALQAMRQGGRPPLMAGPVLAPQAGRTSLSHVPPRAASTSENKSGGAPIGSVMPSDVSGVHALHFFGEPGTTGPRQTSTMARLAPAEPTVPTFAGSSPHLFQVPPAAAVRGRLPMSAQTGILPAITAPPPQLMFDALDVSHESPAEAVARQSAETGPSPASNPYGQHEVSRMTALSALRGQGADPAGGGAAPPAAPPRRLTLTAEVAAVPLRPPADPPPAAAVPPVSVAAAGPGGGGRDAAPVATSEAPQRPTNPTGDPLGFEGAAEVGYARGVRRPVPAEEPPPSEKPPQRASAPIALPFSLITPLGTLTAALLGAVLATVFSLVLVGQPSAEEARAAIEAEREQRLAALEADMERFLEAQDEQLASLSARNTVGTELDRARRQVQRERLQREADLSRQRREVQEDADRRMEDLGSRTGSSARRAMRNGAVGGGILGLFLFGFWDLRRDRAGRDPAAPGEGRAAR